MTTWTLPKQRVLEEHGSPPRDFDKGVNLLHSPDIWTDGLRVTAVYLRPCLQAGCVQGLVLS